MADASTDGDMPSHTGPARIPWAAPTPELVPVWLVSTVCVVLGLLVAAKEISGHWRHWTHPKMQHYETRLLMIMPVYGLTALIGMIFPLTNATCALIRLSAQAYAAYNFVILLIAYFAPHETEERRVAVLGRILAKMDSVRAKPPCCCCGRVKPSLRFVKKKMVQPVRVFAVAVPLFAIVGELCSAYNVYTFGSFEQDNAFFYLNLLTVACTMYGLSAVFLGYQVLEPLLPKSALQNASIHIILGPLVIQEVIITIIAINGGIDVLFGLPPPGSIAALINLLLCIECFVVGLVFAKAFSHKPYIGMDAETHRFHEEWVRLPTGRHFSVIAELDAEHNHGDDGGAAVAAAAVKAVEEADGGGDADASGGVSAEDVTVGTSGAGAGLLDNAAPAGVTEEGHADATATADDTGAAAASTTHAEGGSAAASADDSTGASVEDADGGGPHKVHVHKPAHTDAV